MTQQISRETAWHNYSVAVTHSNQTWIDCAFWREMHSCFCPDPKGEHFPIHQANTIGWASR